ncbi:MAG: phosphatase PAP2 family protein [Opitutae bacterium]|nr:phosphatase PAP2 family protein [Opitutae bacterium]
MLKSKLAVTGLIISLSFFAFTVIEIFKLDLKLSHLIYQNYQWEKGNENLWQWFYNWGPTPSILSGIFCLLFWFHQKVIQKAKNINTGLILFPLLTLLIGPGIMVNMVGKELWGRPRPVNCIDFGGEHQFKHVSEPSYSNHHKSFPSGHAASGFHLCALSIYFRKKWKFYSFCTFACWGILISTARLLQGGHFISDIFGAIILVALTFVLLYPKSNHITNQSLD